jgi:hypothetical protein
MKTTLWSFLTIVSILIAADVAQADTITYTFVGAGGASGTNLTLVDPNGYLTGSSTNLIGLVQTATDLLLFDPGTNSEDDFGPLTNILVTGVSGQPNYYGITLGSSSFTLAALLIPKADFTTPGTYELADIAEIQGSLAPDQGTLTITATPEPSSAALTLSGIGLGLTMLMRKRNSRGNT